MFERFRRLREAWGVHVIPWRNLREIYGVLRHREMLALLIDWGYRSDGIPVRLFGAWTTLPAGPATLAAKTGSAILPVAIRRTPDGIASTCRTRRSSPSRRARRPTSSGRPRQIADALEATVGAAPEQWYSFKPMWPPTQAEAAELEARAAAMLADDGSAPARRGAADSPASPAADVRPRPPPMPRPTRPPSTRSLRTAEA